MRYAQLHNLQELLPGIRARADDNDQNGEWSETDLRVLANIGAMRWAVPMPAGGEELSAIELHFRYETIASASLATALILSQRDSAVDLIDASNHSPSLREELLPKLANNDVFTTIGIAQLTTSRQGGPPAFRATPIGDGYRLDGVIPWATGAGKSDYLVGGAVLPDLSQILFALPMNLPGVVVDPPMPLVALRASWTTQVRCDGAILDSHHILRGPAERALVGRKRQLTLGQTFLALGLASGGIDLIHAHKSTRAQTAAAHFEEQFSDLRREILDLSAPGNETNAAVASPRIRGACNNLALRITNTAVTLYKGSALLAGHPAQRMAREAMFLLVWSCPNPVIDCTVETLSGK